MRHDCKNPRVTESNVNTKEELESLSLARMHTSTSFSVGACGVLVLFFGSGAGISMTAAVTLFPPIKFVDVTKCHTAREERKKMSGYGSLPLPLSARRTMRCKQLRMGGMQLFPVGAGRLQPNLFDAVPDSRPDLRTRHSSSGRK